MPRHVQAVVADGLSSDLVHQHGGKAMLPPMGIGWIVGPAL